MWGGSSGYTDTFRSSPDGQTDVNVVIVRQGKNPKGRFLAPVLRSIGKGVLKKSFVNSVRAIEAHNNGTVAPSSSVSNRRGDRGGVLASCCLLRSTDDSPRYVVYQ